MAQTDRINGSQIQGICGMRKFELLHLLIHTYLSQEWEEKMTFLFLYTDLNNVVQAIIQGICGMRKFELLC
jgi:hypothetical protein